MDDTDPIPWHVLGAGALGCLWGVLLARGGQTVTLLLRDTTAWKGTVSLSTGGQVLETTLDAAQATAPGPPVRRLLVTLKAQDTVAAVQSVAHRLAPDAEVVLMQNGMGIADALARILPGVALVLASTTNGAYREEPFRVVHAGRGETWLGDGPVPLPSARRRRLLADLATTGLPVSWEADIAARLWDKLAVNCAINPLTALLGCRNGALLESADTGAVLQTVCQEVAAVMQVEGRPCTAATLLTRVSAVARATAGNYSSMCQDLARGRGTEIEHITGYLVRRGEALGVALPVNTMLLRLVRAAQALAAAGGRHG